MTLLRKDLGEKYEFRLKYKEVRNTTWYNQQRACRSARLWWAVRLRGLVLVFLEFTYVLARLLLLKSRPYIKLNLSVRINL